MLLNFGIDRDGTIDMVFPTCAHVSSSTGVGTDCYINVAFNEQLQLCASSTDSGVKNGVRVCRPPEDLCTPDPNFRFNLTDSPDNPVSFRSTLCCVILQDTDFLPLLRHSFASLCLPSSLYPLHCLYLTRP